MWNSLLNALGSLLAFFYGWVHSYGISIILVTVMVRLALFPLTAKQARSMTAMQKVQPEIKRIHAMHKDDPQKRNEETMRLYKEHGINPLAGCLPLVAQMPIFFALFRVLRKAYVHVPVGSDLYRALCASSSVAHCKPTGLKFLSVNLSKAANAAPSGFANASPYFILIALVVVTGYLQQKQMQGRQPAGQANAQMQMVGRVMPVMFGFISFQMPAGLVLYFVVSNLWQMGQQTIVHRSMSAEGAVSAAPPKSVKAKPTELPKGKPTELPKGDMGSVNGEAPKGEMPSPNDPLSKNRSKRRKRRN